MEKRLYVVMVVIFSFMVITVKAHAGQKYQEFPIAVGPDSTFSASAARGSDSTWLVAIFGDTLSQYNVTAQIVSPPDQVIGNRISIGRQAVFPGPRAIFDGNNYLMIWQESNGHINGQLISTSGNLSGSYFTIATQTSYEYTNVDLSFGDTASLVVFAKNDTLLYGQLLGRNGNLIGPQIRISNNYARESSIAYDGTNWLVTWVEVNPSHGDKDIYGQFVSKDGQLVGSNFLIDGGPNLSDNSLSLSFDGSRYLLAFHESPDTNSPWTLYGFFITTAGIVQDTIIICDSTKSPVFPRVTFDGNNYLITWTQITDLSLMGQIWTPSGAPVDTPFIISTGGRFPLGGCGYGGNLYFIVWTELDKDSTSGDFNFTNGDVYGNFIQKTGIDEKSNKPEIENLKLLQNTPNPFKRTTVIKYVIPGDGFVNLAIYNAYGQLVYTLVKEKKHAGTHTAIWSGRDERGNKVESGIYFYRLEVGNSKDTKEMLLIK